MPRSLEQTFELIKSAQNGNSSALNDLFKRYSNKVLCITRLKLGKGLRFKMEESLDIVQDTFIRAIKDFNRFDIDNEGALINWLSVLIDNSIRDKSDYYKADKRKPEQNPTIIPFDQTPSIELFKNEDVKALENAISKLSRSHKEVILLRDLEKLEFKEIGKIIKRSEDSARMLYVRAKSKLISHMEVQAV
ncbi:RNA polymerase sigma factor [Elusimicrobiota bacterium]